MVDISKFQNESFINIKTKTKSKLMYFQSWQYMICTRIWDILARDIGGRPHKKFVCDQVYTDKKRRSLICFIRFHKSSILGKLINVDNVVARR